MVRVTTPKGMVGGAMMWGAFQAIKLVDEFATCHFTDHPRISSLLAITLMQKEGQAIKELVVDINRETGKLSLVEKRLGILEIQVEKLTDKN